MDAVVPLWIRCVPLGVALVFAPFTYLWIRGWTWLVLRRYRHAVFLDPHLHWTERARLSLAARTFGTVGMFVFPLLAALFAKDSVGSLSLASERSVVWVAGLASFSGGYFSLRQLGETLGFKRTPVWYDLRALLFGVQGVLVLTAAVVGFFHLGKFVAARHLEHLLVAAPAIALLWGKLQALLFRAVGVYRPDRALQQSLEPVFRATGLRPKALWVVPTAWANAWAYPLRGTIAVSERLLEVLSPAELAAVVAHELGHLKEGRKAWWRLLASWFVCASSFAYAFVDSEHAVVFLWVTGGAFFAIVKWLRTLSRQREHEADHVAVQATGAALYARALERIYEVNLYPATQRAGTHPSLYDRLEHAGVPPDYPRPALPSRGPRLVATLAMVLFPAIAVTWPRLWQQASGDSAEVAAVITKRAHPLGHLALAAWSRGDAETAIALYSWAEALDVHSPWYPRNLAAVLQQVGDCAAARAAEQRARDKAAHDPSVVEALFPLECDE